MATGLPPDESALPGALWLRGGFPAAYLAANDAASLRWREQFISTCLEQDIPQLCPHIPAQTLRRLWTTLAHEQAQLLNAARLASSLGVSGQTVARYIDLLCDPLLVRRLPPWSGTSSKRLAKAPRIYLRDSGLMHALLGLGTAEALLSHPVAGGRWEGWIMKNLLACAPATTRASYNRTAVGAEVDLELELPGEPVWALEIKRSSAPTVSTGFHLACNDIHPTPPSGRQRRQRQRSDGRQHRACAPAGPDAPTPGTAPGRLMRAPCRARRRLGHRIIGRSPWHAPHARRSPGSRASPSRGGRRPRA